MASFGAPVVPLVKHIVKMSVGAGSSKVIFVLSDLSSSQVKSQTSTFKALESYSSVTSPVLMIFVTVSALDSSLRVKRVSILFGAAKRVVRPVALILASA